MPRQKRKAIHLDAGKRQCLAWNMYDVGQQPTDIPSTSSHQFSNAVPTEDTQILTPDGAPMSMHQNSNADDISHTSVSQQAKDIDDTSSLPSHHITIKEYKTIWDAAKYSIEVFDRIPADNVASRLGVIQFSLSGYRPLKEENKDTVTDIPLPRFLPDDGFSLFVGASTDAIFIIYDVLDGNQENLLCNSNLKATSYFCLRGTYKASSHPPQFDALELMCRLKKGKIVKLLVEDYKRADALLIISLCLMQSGLCTPQFAAEPNMARTKTHLESMTRLMNWMSGFPILDISYIKPKRHKDFDQLFDSIREAHRFWYNSQEKWDFQHPALIPKLRPYQAQAVKWMMKKENYGILINTDKERNENKDVQECNLHTLWHKLSNSSGTPVYYNSQSAQFTKHKFLAMPRIPGGILADEMGLGKTVEVLACILAHPRPGFSQEYLEESAVKTLTSKTELRDSGDGRQMGNGDVTCENDIKTEFANKDVQSKNEPSAPLTISKLESDLSDISNNTVSSDKSLCTIKNCDDGQSIKEPISFLNTSKPESDSSNNLNITVSSGKSTPAFKDYDEQSEKEPINTSNPESDLSDTYNDTVSSGKSSPAFKDCDEQSKKESMNISNPESDLPDTHNDTVFSGKSSSAIKDCDEQSKKEPSSPLNISNPENKSSDTHNNEVFSGKSSLLNKGTNHVQLSKESSSPLNTSPSETVLPGSHNDIVPSAKISPTIKHCDDVQSKENPTMICVPKSQFQCICGQQNVWVDTQKCVQCTECSVWQHMKCVNFDFGHEDVGVYMCPHCCVSLKPVSSSATLIVAPTAICHQWVDEINRHINSTSLRVLVYRGVKKHGFLQPRTLANHDIVITTYDTLRQELNYVDLPHANSDTGRCLRHVKRYMAVPSPLPAVEWWRLCLDEAQMVECPTAKVAAMALRLTAVNRWCVTGTPIQRDLDDLYGLFLFLGVEPYWVQQWWDQMLYKPYCRGNQEPMKKTLAKVLWRSAKKDVIHQIDIPPQTEQVHWLKFSPIEEHFYKRKHEDCSQHFRSAVNRLHVEPDVKLSKLDKDSVKRLLSPLLRLRQACCHPQAVRGEFLPLQKNTMTMAELLKSLTTKTQTECEEAHRQLVCALNGQAAVHLMKEETIEAVNKYRQVLFSVEEQKDKLKTDSLQRLHAMHNLWELLQTKLEGVPPTLRDDQLQAQLKMLDSMCLLKRLSIRR